MTAGSIAAAGQMLEPRSGHSATLLPDGRVLIGGGMRRNQDFYSSAELYDPATGKYQLTEMHFISETKLKDGGVLLAGGYPNSDQATSQDWICRPQMAVSG